MPKITQKLKELYAEMSEHTKGICGTECGKGSQYRCCSSEYCENALDWARELGEPLQPTGHPTLPLMGEKGCIAAPHLRPLCTMHTCDISSLGYRKSEKFGNGQWTKRYFRLRGLINDEEFKMMV